MSGEESFKTPAFDFTGARGYNISIPSIPSPKGARLMKQLAIVALVATLVLLVGCTAKQLSTAANSNSGKSGNNPPAAAPSTSSPTTQPANPIATVETSLGTFKIRLYTDQAPITAGNFVKLVKQHFYDGLIFHRVVPGFVIQAGDPYCSSKDPAEQAKCGQGGPGWTIPLEKAATDLKHDRAGVVAMARTPDPNSAGSQFYIILAPTPQLDGQYAVFGQVTEGLDVVTAIGKVATDDQGHPLQAVLIKAITWEGN
jgi:cyclophilin family peptidyl-prolyl cis-trans isomerase